MKTQDSHFSVRSGSAVKDMVTIILNGDLRK